MNSYTICYLHKRSYSWCSDALAVFLSHGCSLPALNRTISRRVSPTSGNPARMREFLATQTILAVFANAGQPWRDTWVACDPHSGLQGVHGLLGTHSGSQANCVFSQGWLALANTVRIVRLTDRKILAVFCQCQATLEGGVGCSWPAHLVERCAWVARDPHGGLHGLCNVARFNVHTSISSLYFCL